jgi:hypothetical protein
LLAPGEERRVVAAARVESTSMLKAQLLESQLAQESVVGIDSAISSRGVARRNRKTGRASRSAL